MLPIHSKSSTEFENKRFKKRIGDTWLKSKREKGSFWNGEITFLGQEIMPGSNKLDICYSCGYIISIALVSEHCYAVTSLLWNNQFLLNVCEKYSRFFLHHKLLKKKEPHGIGVTMNIKCLIKSVGNEITFTCTLWSNKMLYHYFLMLWVT